MQDVDADAELYEAARRLLGKTKRCKYVEQGILWSEVVPSLQVAGFDSRSQRDSDSVDKRVSTLLERYPSGVVPAQDVSLGHVGQCPRTWRDVLPMTMQEKLDKEVETCAPVLSHLAVASAASTPQLTPTLPAKSSFGTLLVFLSTACEGGHVTIKYKTFSTPMVTGVKWGSYAVVHRRASISMAPVASGHVVIAVFDLVDTHPPNEAPPLSPEFEATVAALNDVVAAPRVAPNVVGFALKPAAGRSLIWNVHRSDDYWAFLTALLETKAFDVASVQSQRVEPSGDGPFKIHTGYLYPNPSRLEITSARCPIQGFIGGVDVDELARPGTKKCLVFWPTVCRSRILGPEDTIFSLATITDAGLRRRCLEDTLEDFQGNLDFFASTIHRALELFGADALLPALEELFANWQTNWIGFANGVQLLASLAGVSADAVCAGLPLSRADELRLYMVLFPDPTPERLLENENLITELMQAALLDAVRLEAYLWDDPLHGVMLPELIQHVYAFRLPPPRLEALVIANADIFPPLTVVAPVVLALAPTRLVWCDELLRVAS
ncbi:hypothetical protein SDRG_14097 [Saprolegnia diclina VS20]|uniref:Uncharacterized protein n=1 Tax=Saprolegnia diclina (strain VS20) TaxID=1156394 RepID=T0Q3Z0_SAPDV|nr:hypothetical protein SDRG_14097 [Saprolegnia diclina VS20]EQC28140.1 hypothetical protein SDRG_14097 [Saprolegnia diclina VS20]|eukprot:XP_008618426.1 hypothetical protein SDRG_14097 [Saprolegnia diclina VS20]